MSSLKTYWCLCVLVLATCLSAGLQSCGGGTSGGSQGGPNGQPDTSVTADGEADQGCYGCILDVGKDGKPNLPPDGFNPTDQQQVSTDGDGVIVTGCQNDNDCVDEFDCTVDTCLPDGACQSLPDDKLCGNGEVCDLEHGGCFKAKSCFNDEQCDDGIECTVEGCNTETNLCYPAIKDDSRCENGFVCLPQHPEADLATGCVEGSHCEKDTDCISDILCLTGQCLLDICEWTPNDATCDDNNVCNGNEVCDPTNGCQSINPLVCDDQIECTKDDCLPDFDSDSDSVCIHTPSDDLCDDGLFCNGQEVCNTDTDCQSNEPLCQQPPEYMCPDNDCPVIVCNEQTDTCEECTPQCEGKKCGDDDECGGTCLDDSMCDDGSSCTKEGCNWFNGYYSCKYEVQPECSSPCNYDENCYSNPYQSCNDWVTCTWSGDAQTYLCYFQAEPNHCTLNNTCIKGACGAP